MAEESNQVEADLIKANIERTRDNMSGTIDEIQERLNPSNLVQQAKDSVREAAAEKVKGVVSTAKDAVNTASVVGKRAVNTASEAGRRALGNAGATAKRAAGQARTSGTQAVSTARENPVGAALLASGVAWLIARGLTSRRRSPDYYSRREDRDAGLMGNRHAQGAFMAGVLGYYLISRQMASGDAGTSFGSNAAGTSGSTTDRLRRTLAEPARELGASAQRLARQAQRKAGDYAVRSQDVTDQVSRWVGENPLAVGAAVVALGTVIGLSITDDDDADWMDGQDDRRGRASNM